MTAIFIPKKAPNGHDLRCRCDECEDINVSQFKPFHHAPWHIHFINGPRSCPSCKRSVYGRGRGGFMLWVCWSCISKTAKVVKLVNHRGYGFADTADNITIYFHFSRQVTVYCDGGSYPMMNDTEIPPNNAPAVDDVIRFADIQGDKSLKAFWWCFEPEYQTVLEAINNRSLYRMMRREGRLKLSRLDEAPRMTNIWEGKDLSNLRRNLAARGWSLHNEMYSAVYFERQVSPETADEKAVWEPCDDPR